MDKTVTVGLKICRFGDAVASLDAMVDTSLTQLSRTLRGTAQFTSDADTVTDIYCEEEDEPILSVTTQYGLKTLQLNFVDMDPETLAKVFGGTVSETTKIIDGKTYNAKVFTPPVQSDDIYMAVRAITKKNFVIDIPKAKIIPQWAGTLAADTVLQVQVQARVQTPDTGASYATYPLGTEVQQGS
jgi:hypothetical protein